MRGRPSGLVESARGEANRILSASALSSMRIICLNRISRHDWIIPVSLGCMHLVHIDAKYVASLFQLRSFFHRLQVVPWSPAELTSPIYHNTSNNIRLLLTTFLLTSCIYIYIYTDLSAHGILFLMS